mmetsp:Transcript_11098/g.19329  ORF Transcript_11098/g.19329 Transcript_11098/m.19329 type:complete len:269 (-) Transcript_11098:300-1106(-)
MNTLSVQMHVCPELRNALATVAVAANSRSASSNTTRGALPPNSRDTRLTEEAADAISSLPTAVDPVNPIFRTLSFVVSSRPMAGASPMMMFKHPSGRPARSANTARARAERGVDSAGFSTTVHPAASAGATFRVIILIGKFQGVIAPTTPTGCFRVTMRRSRDPGSSTSPVVRLHSSANHSTDAAPPAISASASDRGFPHSIVMMVAKSSVFARISSCHFFKTADRSFAVFLLQLGKTASAAAMAARASIPFIKGSVARSFPLAGFVT